MIMDGGPGWIVTVLQQYGLAGIVIFVLGFIVYVMYKSSIDVNNSRLGERDTLLSALASNTAAIKENARVTEERNSVTEKLASAIGREADIFEMFTSNAKNQQEMVRDQTFAQTKTIEALAESNRVNTGILRDVRDQVQKLVSGAS